MGRREDNKRHKREALERAALDAFRTRGYEGASIEQIAQAAGVARGTFYLYFPDKLALFEALCDRWYLSVQAVLGTVAADLDRATTPADALAVYRRMAVGLAAGVLGHTAEVEIAFRESRQPGEAGQSLRRRERAMLDQVGAFTAIAAERGLIAVRDPKLAALIVYGSVERLFYEALLGTPLGDPLVAGDEVLRLFAAAFGLDTGPPAA
ncbi:MAG: TetR/AcrR family transcriptional regulator [Myxococcota bacterium]